MDSQGKTTPKKEKTTEECVLCSPHFKDILITPEDLMNIHVTSQHKEISVKQI